MRILFVTSEMAPLIKTGGLADVSAALPVALRELGEDVRVLIPGYSAVIKALPNLKLASEMLDLDGYPETHLLEAVSAEGVPLWVIDSPELFRRGGGPYQDENGQDWMDNAQRFGLLSNVAAILASKFTPLAWKPDVVHCNDWQSGLTPAYLNFLEEAVPSVMTIHNLAFQGIFPPSTVVELGLPWSSYQPNGLEFYDNMSFMKAGLYYSDHITTVSPTYAKEIQTDALGFGLQGLLQQRSQVVTGILNGIDMHDWNPETDKNLAKNYSKDDMAGKAANKLELQKRMGLHVDADIPLFGMVSRFTHQKGLDIVLQIAAKLVKAPAQIVFLGNGDAEMQRTVLDLAHHNSGSIGAYVGFDEGLSHLIEAGADFFLMPSRFEPCGLNQMYSQRYGTPPIVHATGGLVDSVVDVSPSAMVTKIASGFVFNEMTPQGLSAAVERALAAYRDKRIWPKIQTNGMAKDFGWSKSAEMYRAIYQTLIK